MEIKAALVPQNHLEVGAELAIRAHKPPTSMQFLSQLSGNHASPFTACRYKGITYVGLSNGAINKVDKLGNNTANFIKLTYVVITIRAHMDQLFILENGNPSKIHVYDLTGRVVKSWTHTGTSSRGNYHGNKLFVSKNEVFVADALNSRIVLYDLSGNLKRTIPCPTMQKTYTSMCSAGKDCVIITSYSPSQASMFNFKTGTVVWTTALTYHPFSSTCLAQTVLVGLNGYDHARGIWIDVLNIENGECY